MDDRNRLYLQKMFGEHIMATTMENITKELTAKIAPYNMLVNL